MTTIDLQSRRSSESSDLVLKAVVISDDPALLSKADAALQRVGRQPNVEAHWNVISLSIGALNDDAIAGKSLVEAADAQLIVIPAQHAWDIPVYLREWLEQWAALRQVQDAALAILSYEVNAGFTKRVSPELTRLAQKHGLNFITSNTTNLAEKRVVRFSRHAEQQLSASVVNTLSAMAAGSLRGFGINE